MKAYWDSLTKEQQGELAGKVGSTPGYLRLVFNGYKKASFVLAKKLEQCTSGAITKSDLRPDIRTATNPIPKIWEKSLSARPSRLMWWAMTALTSAIA